MSPEAPPPTARVGWGFDAHVLTDEPPVILGGVVVSDTRGVEATSDGDVLAHAVIDAVLGACVLGDLGEHFPSDDPALAGADSMFLLRQAATMAVAAGFLITHIDVTVVAEDVRVAAHRNAIVASLAEALGVPPDSISVKATTTDGLGFIGRGEGLAAVAVATVTTL
jgi:2-C-methyl-D-erythritol 2,4-cyclodiphosphate synthase